MIFLAPIFLWYVLIGISSYKLFEKAGEPGWKGAIPFYNLYAWLELSDRPKWWLPLLFVPILNVFIFGQMIMDLLKSFDRTDFHDYFLGLLVTPVYFTWMSFDDSVEWNAPATHLEKITKSTLRDWTDSILFAVVAATLIRWFLIEAFTIPTPSMESSLMVGDFLFVSKVNYGPRVPQTPLSFPFAHNTLPMTAGTKSYLEWLQLPYYRIPGFEDIERNHVVVFNWPGDIGRPNDKKENYIKRCIAIAGDKVEINDDVVSVNGKVVETPEKMQFLYEVIVNRYGFSKKELNDAGVSLVDLASNYAMESNPATGQYKYRLNMSPESAAMLKSMSKVQKVERIELRGGNLYMNEGRFTMANWGLSNFGPLWVPKKGDSIEMNDTTFHLYKECITRYENAGNLTLEKDRSVTLDGKPLKYYTFKMDYYWMMGDNRHNSADSRMWGFVPEDHIVGKALFIWFSWDTHQESLADKVRWDRLFNPIH